MTTTALTTTSGAGSPLPTLTPANHDSKAFEPSDIGQALYLADVLFVGGLLPSSFKRSESVVTAIILGRELGLSAMQSIRGIHVIEGRPTLSADMMVGLVKRSPICRYFRLVESTTTTATYETHRDDEPEPTRMSYGQADAVAAGKWGAKGPWSMHPAAMLRARCSSSLARAVYPDVVAGLYDPDEMEPVQAAPVYHVEPGRVVNTGTGEVIDGTVIADVQHSVDPACADPLASFGGQDNGAPVETPWARANKKLRAVAARLGKEAGIKGAQVGVYLSALIHDRYKVESSKDCTPEQLEATAELLDSGTIKLVPVLGAPDLADDDIPLFSAEPTEAEKAAILAREQAESEGRVA